MAGGNDSKDLEPAWHERTSTVLGASFGAIVVLAILFFGVSCVSREFNDPPPPSQYFVEPSVSGSGSYTSRTTTTTTTQTITSTSPPVTTDINPGDPTTTSGTDTSTSDSSSSSTTTSRTRSSPSTDDGATSSSRRPRFNETRTLNPRPYG